MFNNSHQSGWWLSPTPLKNDEVSNSWDDDIPNWMESHKIPWFQTTNQIFYCIKFGWMLVESPRFGG